MLKSKTDTETCYKKRGIYNLPSTLTLSVLIAQALFHSVFEGGRSYNPATSRRCHRTKSQATISYSQNLNICHKRDTYHELLLVLQFIKI